MAKSPCCSKPTDERPSVCGLGPLCPCCLIFHDRLYNHRRELTADVLLEISQKSNLKYAMKIDPELRTSLDPGTMLEIGNARLGVCVHSIIK